MDGTLDFTNDDWGRAFNPNNARTATGMDGTLHTDFRKSETSRDIKKSF